MLANPLETKKIAHAKIKNYRLGVSILADLLRGVFVYESYAHLTVFCPSGNRALF